MNNAPTFHRSPPLVPKSCALAAGAVLWCTLNLCGQTNPQPAGQTNINGGTVSFSVPSNGTAPLSYQWYFENGNSNLTLSPVQGGAAVITTNRAGTDLALPPVKLERVFPAARIDRPLWMEEAPDGSGRMFVIEQRGIILMLQKGSDGAKANEVLRIGGAGLYDQQANEKGLLGFAFHPKFKENGKFYVYYTHELNDGSITTVTSEFKMSAKDPDIADPASERKLLVIQRPWWNHEGGCLAFGPDGCLYISSGDGGHQRDPYNNGQNLSLLLAKMLRIDVDHADPGKNYAVPRDNPFVNTPGAAPEIWAYGLRNPWRFSFDKQTGLLWEGDVGEDNWEEVNLITKGGNYGWSIREGFHEFKTAPPGGSYIDPVLEYAHNGRLAAQSPFPNHSIGVCIIGGFVYRGKKYPSLDGIYIYGDYGLGTIWGMRYENGKITGDSTLLLQPKNIGSFAQDADGEVYMLSLSDNRIFAIVPAAENLKAANQ